MYQPQPQYGGGFPPQQQPKGCWGRNWKWIVPAGCLGLLIIVAALGAGIFFVVMSAVKSSEVYRYALAKAKSNPTVVAELGEPIKDGWLVQGSVNEQLGGHGEARFQIPISGPKKSGTIYVEALKDPQVAGGDWYYTNLFVEVAGRDDKIDLREKNANGVGSEENDNANEEGGAPVTGGDEPPPPPLHPPPPGHTIVSGGVLNGKAISKPEPTYPAIAKAARAQGTVVVQVVVDEEGNVISASAASGHPLLQPAAIAAARQAKFAPYKLNGQPVKVTGTLTYNFVLE
jgi:TonB family protein